MTAVGGAMSLVVNTSGRAVTSANTANNRIEMPTSVASSAGDFTIVFHGLVPAEPFMLANFSNLANPSPPNYEPTSGYLWWTQGLYANPNGFICGMSLNNANDYPEQNFQVARPTGPCTAAFSFVNNAVLRFALNGYAEERAYAFARQVEDCNSISIGSTNQDINGQGQYNATIVYNRALSLAEMRSITRNPWQVIARKRYAFPLPLLVEATGGSTSALDSETVQSGTAQAASAIAASAAGTLSASVSSAGSTVIAGGMDQRVDAVLASASGAAAIAAASASAAATGQTAGGTLAIAGNALEAPSVATAADGAVAIAGDAAQTTAQADSLSAAAVAVRQADLDGAVAFLTASDARAEIGAGIARYLDPVLGTASGTAALAGALAGDAQTSGFSEAVTAIAAASVDRTTIAGDLSGSAVAGRQADALQQLDPVASEMGVGAAISGSLGTGIESVLGSLASSAGIAADAAETAASAGAIAGTLAITADLVTRVDVDSVAIAAARIGASMAMRAAVLDAMQARGSLELLAARTARARRPMTRARAQRPQNRARAVARATTCKAVA